MILLWLLITQMETEYCKQYELGEYTPTGDETVADALDSENATIRAVAMIIDGNENQYTPKEIYTQVSNYLTSSI